MESPFSIICAIVRIFLILYNQVIISKIEIVSIKMKGEGP